MQLPDALDDADVQPQSRSLKSLQSSKKTMSSSNSANPNLKGSKRANALISNISKKGVKPSDISGGTGKSLHRSLSLPGRQRNSPQEQALVSDSDQGFDRIRRLREIQSKAKIRASHQAKMGSEEEYIYSEASNGSYGYVSDNKGVSDSYSEKNYTGGNTSVQIIDDSPMAGDDSLDSAPSSSRDGSRVGSQRESYLSPPSGRSSSSFPALLPSFQPPVESTLTTTSHTAPKLYMSSSSSAAEVGERRDISTACMPLFNRPAASGSSGRAVASASPAVAGAISSTTPGGDSQTREERSPGDVNEEEDQLLNSMCFSTDDRATSLTATPCGSYVVAGFASGTVKLYEMLRSGNTDLEDRYGYVLGHLNSSGVQGSLRLHVEAGRCDVTSSRRSFVSHVFAGAMLGSTNVFVADIQSIHRLKKKRGFITMAGGGVKTFSHSDLRLRGFTSLAAVYHSYTTTTALPPVDSGGAEGHTAVDTDGSRRRVCGLCAEEAGYRAVYRLITGKGYGVYNIWEVELVAQVTCPVCSVEGIDRGDGSTPSAVPVPEGLEVTTKYSQSWQILTSGTVNGPSMDFSQVFISPSLGSLNTTSLESILASQTSDHLVDKPGFSRGAFLEFITQGNDKDARIQQSSCCVKKVSEENAYEDIAVPNPKPRPLKGLAHIHAVSSDGCVIFGGTDELLVYRLSRQKEAGDVDDLSSLGHLEIGEILTFSLTEIAPVSGAGSSSRGASSKWACGAPSRRGGRHLRQIEEVSCSADGQYALVRCSDNAVVLYSLFDIFGAGCLPTKTELRSDSGAVSECASHDVSSSGRDFWNSSRRSWPNGFVTLWYHADEEYGLRLALSYIVDDSRAPPVTTVASQGQSQSQSDSVSGGNSGPSEVDEWEAAHGGLRHPSSVLVLATWWPLFGSRKEGVLKAGRLWAPSTPVVSLARSIDPVFPCDCSESLISIAKPGIGLALAATAVHSNVGICWLCGSSSISHWPELPHEEVEESDTCEVLAAIVDAESEANQTEDDDDDGGDVARRKRVLEGARDDGNIVSKKRRESKMGQSSGHSRPDDLEDEDFVTSSANSKTKTKKSAKVASGSGGALTGRKASSSDAVRMQKQILSLEAELASTRDAVKAKEKECNILVRKFDKRFAKEMETRRAWNAEKRLFEGKVLSLEGQSALLESRAVAAESENKMLMDSLTPLCNFLSATGRLGGMANIGGLHVARQNHQFQSLPCLGSSSSNPNHISATGGLNSPFCVVCQAFTADTVLIDCGHLCLCYEHAITMRAQGRLAKCPLCNKPCTSICRAVS